MYKKIFHICPEDSLFHNIVQQKSKSSNQFLLSFKSGFINALFSSFEIVLKNYKNKNSLFIFHRVDNLKISFIRIISLKKFNYCLIYWGSEYYLSFIDERILDYHCLKKINIYKDIIHLLNIARNENNQLGIFIRKIKKKLFKYLALNNVDNSISILGMPNKQFKILKFIHFKYLKKNLKNKNLFLFPYIDLKIKSNKNYLFQESKIIKFFISHSAAYTLHHEAVIEIIKIYSIKWDCKVSILGFISYSGGDEDYRINLQKKLTKASSFAESSHFELNFLDRKAYEKLLSNFDIAINLSSRDEGLTSLINFGLSGGLLCFNKYSLNYDMLKKNFKESTIGIDEFLNIPPKKLKLMRKSKKTFNFKNEINYNDLKNIDKFLTKKNN